MCMIGSLSTTCIVSRERGACEEEQGGEKAREVEKGRVEKNGRCIQLAWKPFTAHSVVSSWLPLVLKSFHPMWGSDGKKKKSCACLEFFLDERHLQVCVTE